MKKIKYLIVVFCCFCMLNLLAGCKNETNSQQSGSVNNSINNSGNEPAPTHTAVTPGNTVITGNTETPDNTVTPTVSEAPANNSDDEDKDRNTKADADDTENSREEAGEETKEEVKEETKKTDENDVAECPYPMDVLPVVTIDTGRKSISESKEYTPVVMSFYSPDGSYIKIEQNSGIRTRGNFSKGLAKKSYKFKLEEKKNLYGL